MLELRIGLVGKNVEISFLLKVKIHQICFQKNLILLQKYNYYIQQKTWGPFQFFADKVKYKTMVYM